MKYVFLVLRMDNNEPIALYNDVHIAEKLKAEIEKKIGAKVRIQKMSVNLTLDLIGIRL